MNLNLIIKLAKLANENPNENEANLAARKVCSLIKQGDYKFNEDSKQSNTKSTSNSSSPYYDPFEWIRKQYEDNMRYGSWEGFGSNEKKERSNPNARSYSETSSEYKNRTEYKPKDKYKWYYTNEKQEEYYNGTKYDYIAWDDLEDDKGEPHRKKKDNPDRLLKCKICGKQRLTAFVGLESMYECFTCQFTPQK